MEREINNDEESKIHSKESRTISSNTSDSVQKFASNQNGLSSSCECKDQSYSETSQDQLDEDGDSTGAEPREIRSLEAEKKTDNRIVLCVKKKPSFMVSAILETDKNIVEMQAGDVKGVNNECVDRLIRNDKSDDDINVDFDNNNVKTAPRIEHSAPNDFIMTQIKTRLDSVVEVDYSSQITNESFLDTVKNIPLSETLDESNYKPDREADATDNRNSFPISRKEEANMNDNQLQNVELKIHEIKKHKEEEILQEVSEVTEERRVRKRKQERPQPINVKQRKFETEVVATLSVSSGRKSKRKQTVTKRHLQYDTDSESESSNEIKQTPLCSKLCTPEFRKSTVFPKRNIVHQSNIDENSQSEDSNMPCTTNRYRRHFLKQLRNAEAAKSKAEVSNEIRSSGKIVTDDQNINTNDKDYDSEDDYFFDGKRIKINEVEERFDSNKCKVCNKEFSDIGTLMAHFICHSSIEKEQANFLHLNQNTGTPSTLETSTYFCHLCSQKFTNIATLQEHVLEHSANFTSKQQGSFECNLCQKTFATAGSLYLHKKVHTGENPYTCHDCQKHFRDKTRLTTHMRVHTGEKPFICEFCSKKFSQKGNLKLHQQKIHLGMKRGKHRCRQCSVNFSDKNDLKEHIRKTHHGKVSDHDNKSPGTSHEESDNGTSKKKDTESSNKTTHLKESNTIKNGLSESDLIEEGEKTESLYTETNDLSVSVDNAACENTNSSLSESSLVLEQTTSNIGGITHFGGLFPTNHVDSNLSLAPAETLKLAKFTCPICDLPFQTATSFNRHFIAHGSSVSPFRPLGTRFSMIAQSGSEFPSGVKKVYRCEECSLDFVSFTEFQSHLKSHKDGTSKALSCAGSSDKEAHTKTDETWTMVQSQITNKTDRLDKVMCNICHKQMSSSNLLDHMRIHTGEKPYGCVHCGKLFRRSHHLQTHLRTHTGDRPYVCVDCGKTFARGDHLQNHRRTHTGEKPYKCEICDKSYSQSHHLLRHKRTHTGEKPYNCELCDKKFSRDHHLKKHMETHRVVIYTGEKDGTAQKSGMKLKLELPSTPMVTRGSDRVAQLLSSSWYNNIASELMADMVHKHITAQQTSGTLAQRDTATAQNTSALIDTDTGIAQTGTVTAQSEQNEAKNLGDAADSGLDISKGSVDLDQNHIEIANSIVTLPGRSIENDVVNSVSQKDTQSIIADFTGSGIWSRTENDVFTHTSKVESDKKAFFQDSGTDVAGFNDAGKKTQNDFIEKVNVSKDADKRMKAMTEGMGSKEIKANVKTISFMNQLRAISMASTLDEIVKQRLNEGELND